MNRRTLTMPDFSRLSALRRIFLFLCIAVVTAVTHIAGMRALASSGSALAASGNAPEDDGQWPMPAKDYANTRYSGLTDITTENVKQLKPAWTFSTGVNRRGCAPHPYRAVLSLIV